MEARTTGVRSTSQLSAGTLPVGSVANIELTASINNSKYLLFCSWGRT
jgi:hypothetical protein